jgi:hypothetical protein
MLNDKDEIFLIDTDDMRDKIEQNCDRTHEYSKIILSSSGH